MGRQGISVNHTTVGSICQGYPVTVRESETLQDVAAALSAAGASAAIVLDMEDELVGLVDDAAIICFLADEEDPARARVARAMRRWPATIDRSRSVEDAITMMAREGVDHLPVQGDGRLCGLVSLRDVVLAQAREIANRRTLLTSPISVGG